VEAHAMIVDAVMVVATATADVGLVAADADRATIRVIRATNMNAEKLNIATPAIRAVIITVAIPDAIPVVIPGAIVHVVMVLAEHHAATKCVKEAKELYLLSGLQTMVMFL
jgi:hypothetical protein